jgi:FtsH-binding integral membrane protein
VSFLVNLEVASEVGVSPERAGKDEAIPLAASIFLDVFNIFLFFLQLFGGRS